MLFAMEGFSATHRIFMVATALASGLRELAVRAIHLEWLYHKRLKR